MIVDSLHDIACHSNIEERNWQIHQFDKEIGNQGDVDSRRKMQQYPTPDKLQSCSTRKQEQLRKQNQINKMNILVLNPNIHNTLCQERKNKLQ